MLDAGGCVDLLFLKCVFGRAIGLPVVRLDDVPGRAQPFPAQSEAGAIKQRRIKPNLSGVPLSVYLMTGTLTGLLGNRILLMSRSKTRAVAS